MVFRWVFKFLVINNSMMVPINNTGNIVKDAEADLKKRIEKLEKISKPLDELVVSEDFIVRQVISQSYSKSFTPSSEMTFGGKSKNMMQDTFLS